MTSRFRLSTILALLTLVTPSRAQTVPDFGASPTGGAAALAVQFTNLSTSDSPIVLYTWDFGDGTPVSTSPSPAHLYTAAGTYTVSLSAWPLIPPGQPTVTETKPGFIVVTTPSLDVDFSATPTSGELPLTVAFTDLTTSSGTLSDWTWDFGDGATSHAQHPVHKYVTVGTYSVTLTASAGETSASATKTDLVEVAPPSIVPAFEVDPSPTTAGLLVHFTDTSSGGTQPPTSWKWTFGDGKSSTLKSPAHIYELAGRYHVSLTVTLLGWSATVSVPQAVIVGVPDLNPSFSVPYTSGAAPLVVPFTDTSTGTPADSWSWDFGDGTTPSYATSKNPTHTFQQPGTYDVKLVIRLGAYGKQVTMHDLVTVFEGELQPSLAYFPKGGLLPLEVSFVDTSTGSVPFATTISHGDGSSTSGTTSTHTYTSSGWFSPDVELAAIPPALTAGTTYPDGVEAVDPRIVTFASFSASEQPYLGSQPPSAFPDLDADGLPDVVVSFQGFVGTILQDAGGFPLPPHYSEIPAFSAGSISWVGFADMDEDGLPDFVARSVSDPHAAIWLGDGMGGFGAFTSVAVPSTGHTNWGTLVDLDEDGHLDVALGVDDHLRVVFGDGAGGVSSVSSPGLLLDYGSNPRVTDVDLDGHSDLVALRTGGVLIGYGDGSTIASKIAIPYPFFGTWRMADIDGDGLLDGAIQSGSLLAVALGDGVSLAPFVTLPDIPKLDTFTLGDLDGDGRADFVAERDDGSHRILIGRSTSAATIDLWTGLHEEPGGGEPVSLSLVDLDGDGDLDLFSYSKTGPLGSQGAYAVHRNLGVIGRWVDVGGATSSGAGEPHLAGTGALHPLTPVSLELADAPPDAPSWLVLGLADALQPFAGGVLVPSPDVVLGGLVTDGTGRLALDATWPAGIAVMTPLWFQAWSSDAGALVGSNGLLAIAAE